MYVEPRSAFISTPPPSLEAIVQENDLDMVRCESMKCKLTKQACVDRWWVANSEWQLGARKIFECENCAQGEALAKQIKPKPKKRKLKKPWEGLMEERAKKGNKEFSCKEYGEDPAILNTKTGIPLPHGMCKGCFGKKMKKTKAEKAASSKPSP